VPIPNFVPACRCLQDPGLRDFRCGVLLPDLFLVAQLPPLPWPAGQPVDVRWTIHPWTNVGGSYAMSSAARLGGQWVPQQWLGPTLPALQTGALAVEPFRLKLWGKDPIPLRTTLAYRRLGLDKPLRVQVDLLLPQP
jgi:hypothetical protein